MTTHNVFHQVVFQHAIPNLSFSAGLRGQGAVGQHQSQLAALLPVSPLSQFILWPVPFFSKGSIGEWIMLEVWFTVPLIFILIYGRQTRIPLSLKKEYLIPLIFQVLLSSISCLH